MMSLVDFRDSAVRLQQEAHQRREHHRRLQKECELEDQTLQKYLRATEGLIEAKANYDEIAAELTPQLRLALGLIEKPPLVQTKSVVFVPTVVEPVAQEVKPETVPPPVAQKVAPKPAAAKPDPNDADSDVLLIMRANLRPDGVCILRPGAIAEQAEMTVASLSLGPLRRLAAAGLIKKTTEGRYIVSGKDAPAAAVSIQPTRLPKTADTPALQRRLLTFLRRAAKAKANGEVLIEKAKLAEKVGATELRVDDALIDLVAGGLVERRATSLKGHITIAVLDLKEAAE